MTVELNITVPVVSEPITYFHPTPLSVAFTTLLPMLSAHIEAERDLVHVDRWDMAFIDWLAEAEQTRADLEAALNALCETEVQRLEDKPLLRMAMLTRLMLASDDAQEFLQLHSLPLRMPSMFRCAGDHPVAARTNLLLSEVLIRLDALASLPDYLDPIEVKGEAPIEESLAFAPAL
ncbi:hypothetical protein [Paenirhodobacter populi]|uniref:Uncharacterized protein n=1 Tax=Paenirhodobacter populi TaxID=2306993 RepID=A0A443IJZ5_9RHOB|nr:hypothetical protein [Sinirhodobacter populi]RWR04621.1 hypothetical protein D2T33_20920 [Sinirhodobacter populi]